MKSRIDCPVCFEPQESPLPLGLIHTGTVEHPPYRPDGLLYLLCEVCQSWNRYEIPPPNPVVEVAA